MPNGGEPIDLKDIVRPIILAQGNQFIKELLRKHKLKIGLNKSDFEKNLFDAIDNKKLTQEMIEAWLLDIEGWGDQHVYLLSLPSTGAPHLKQAILASPRAEKLGVSVSYEFPGELSLTAIRLDADALSIDWHMGSRGWERAKSKDHQTTIETDLYEFRAYRDRADRSVVRFEWCFNKPYCGLFIQLPNEGDIHAKAILRVQADLKAMGVTATSLIKVPLSQAVKAASDDDNVTTHSTKMSAEGGYVDFVVTQSEGGIADIEVLRKARQGVQDSDFGSAEGMLSFGMDQHPVSRNIKSTIYGSDGRFRIWVQCKREDIYAVADFIWQKTL